MATKKQDAFDSPVYTLGINNWRDEVNKVAAARTQQARSAQRPGSSAASDLNRALASLSGDVQRRLYRENEAFEKKQYQEQKALAKAAEADPMGFALKSAGVASWEQSKPDYFDMLPFSEQSNAYELYLGTAADQAIGVNPELSRDEVMAYLRINNTAPVKPEGGFVRDLGVGLAQGVLGSVQMVSDIIDPSSELSQASRNVSEWMDEQKSDAAKNNVKEREWERAKLSDQDLSILGSLTAEAGIELRNMGVAEVGNLLGNILTSFGIAGGAAKLAVKGTGSAVAAGRVATGVGIGQAGVMAGGDATGSAFDGIMGLTDEEASRLPGWTTALGIAGGDPEQAKKQLAMSAARMATLPGVAAGIGMSALPGSMERAFGRAFNPEEIVSKGFMAKARSYGAAVGLEGVEESLTGLAGAVGQQSVNPDVDLVKGRGSEFALGAVGGLLGRGIAGRVAGRTRRKEDEPQDPPGEDVEIPPTPVNPVPVEPAPTPAGPTQGELLPVEPAPTLTPAAPTPAEPTGRAVLQNRDRSDPNYVAQVRENSANIDPDLLAPGKLFGSGTPVIEDGLAIDPTHYGTTDTATAADGTKFPVQYALVEADGPLASHDANGRAMPGYENGGEGISRVVAGNGRMAFLGLGYENDTAGVYRDALPGFLEQVGIDPTLATSMNKPVLVRVMPANLVTGNIGALSNLPEGSALSPSERATTDAGYIDIDGLSISDEGQFTPKSVIDFINSLPENERIGLMDGQVPSATAIERLRNAVFVKAYGDAELVRLQTQASDPDYKNILAALTRAAPAYARLAGQGEYDLRKVVADTTKAAFNARANGMTIGQYINQESLLGMEGDQRILSMMGENIRSGKRIGDALTDLANRAYVESQKSETADLLGDVPVRIPVDTLINESMNVQAPVEPTQGELVPATPAPATPAPATPAPATPAPATPAPATPAPATPAPATPAPATPAPATPAPATPAPATPAPATPAPATPAPATPPVVTEVSGLVDSNGRPLPVFPDSLGKPRMSYAGKTMTFASDLDTALYVARPEGKSKQKAKYVDWLKSLGFTDESIAAQAQSVVAQTKLIAKSGESLQNIAPIADLPSTQPTPAPVAKTPDTPKPASPDEPTYEPAVAEISEEAKNYGFTEAGEGKREKIAAQITSGQTAFDMFGSNPQLRRLLELQEEPVKVELASSSGVQTVSLIPPAGPVSQLVYLAATKGNEANLPVVARALGIRIGELRKLVYSYKVEMWVLKNKADIGFFSGKDTFEMPSIMEMLYTNDTSGFTIAPDNVAFIEHVLNYFGSEQRHTEARDRQMLDTLSPSDFQYITSKGWISNPEGASNPRGAEVLASLGMMPKVNLMVFNPYIREALTATHTTPLSQSLIKAGWVSAFDKAFLDTIAQGYANKNMPQGIPANVSGTGNILGKSSNVYGVFRYHPNSLGQVDLSGSTVSRTFAHELVHAVSATVLDADQEAPRGSKENNRAQAVSWVFRNVKRAASKVDTTGKGGENALRAYGFSNEYEMLAELTNPRFLTLLDAIELDLTQAPANVQQALSDMGVTGGKSTMADTLLKIFESLLKAFSGQGFTKGNAAHAIAQIADFYKAETQRQFDDGKLTQLLSTDTLPDTGKFSLHNQVDSPPTGGGFGAPAAPDAEVRDPFSSRETYGEVLEDMNEGIAARGATPMREAVHGLLAGDFKRVREALASSMEKANEYFHDNMTPFNTWLNGLVQANFLPDALVTRVRGALYLAPGRRDAFMADAMSKNGGNEINKLIAQLSTETKQSVETVHKQVGYWLTAVRAPDANQQIIDRLQRESDSASKTLQDLLNKADERALTPAEATRYEAARKTLAETGKEIAQRIAALNNPNIDVKKHDIGLAGGMNLAQAKALAESIEKRIPVKKLEAVAKHVYDLNAWRLSLDIETGRSSSQRVAAFLDLDADAIKVMDELRVAGINALGTNPTGDAYVKLNALRKEVAQLVRSNYVPMTGNPLFEADADFISGGSATPNVRDIKLQEGRQSIPDDGLTATLNGVVQSSTYAGYQPFQAEIVNAYNNMTPEARKEAKFGGRKISKGSQGIKENAIVVHLPKGTWEFTIGDGKAIASIRRANMDSNVTFLDKMSTPTRWFSYAAVQLQVFFGPKQFLRDGWEKSEILRTKDLYTATGRRVNANRTGSQMLRNMLNPRLFKVAAQFAFDRTPQDSYEWQMMQELAGAGGLSGFSDRFARERSNVVSNINKHKRVHSRVKDKAARLIDAYNRMFEIAPTLAAYTAMRGEGMSVQGAAAEALDLFNFRKKGSTMPFFTAIYAFAQPAVTGGANIASSLYNRKTGKWNTRVAIPRLVGYTISLLAIQSLARMMGDDDEGGNVIDQQTAWTLNNTLPIQVGDGLVKIPLAFGLVRIANGMARGMMDVGSGEKTLAEASTGFVTGSVISGFSPIAANEIDWSKRPLEALVATFAPTVAAPVLEVVANRTTLDAPVVNLNWEKRDEFRADQYGKNIPEMWGEVARFMQRNFGMDLAPEQYRHLVRGYVIGTPGNILTQTVENPFREERGYTVNNPFLSWLYAQPTEYAIKGQFYGYTEKAEELRREMLTAVKEGRSADIAGMSNEDRQMVALLAKWDEVDKRFRADKTKITKNKALTEAGRQARRKVLDDQLLQFQRIYLQQYRLIENKTTK